MSILQMHIPRARVIDLFAGSGALGLEAISRGAQSAELIEKDARTIRVLKENVAQLGAEESVTIRRADALRFAGDLPARAFDIAFADPPYAGGYAAKLAEIWKRTAFATIMSVEHAPKEKMPGGGETRRYGSSAITFYRSEE